MERHLGLFSWAHLSLPCFPICVSVVKLSEGCYDLCSLWLQGRINPSVSQSFFPLFSLCLLPAPPPFLMWPGACSISISISISINSDTFKCWRLFFGTVVLKSWQKLNQVFKHRPKKNEITFRKIYTIKKNLIKEKKRRLHSKERGKHGLFLPSVPFTAFFLD